MLWLLSTIHCNRSLFLTGFASKDPNFICFFEARIKAFHTSARSKTNSSTSNKWTKSINWMFLFVDAFYYLFSIDVFWKFLWSPVGLTDLTKKQTVKIHKQKDVIELQKHWISFLTPVIIKSIYFLMFQQHIVWLKADSTFNLLWRVIRVPKIWRSDLHFHIFSNL